MFKRLLDKFRKRIEKPKQKDSIENLLKDVMEECTVISLREFSHHIQKEQKTYVERETKDKFLKRLSEVEKEYHIQIHLSDAHMETHYEGNVISFSLKNFRSTVYPESPFMKRLTQCQKRIRRGN